MYANIFTLANLPLHHTHTHTHTRAEFVVAGIRQVTSIIRHATRTTTSRVGHVTPCHTHFKSVTAGLVGQVTHTLTLLHHELVIHSLIRHTHFTTSRIHMSHTLYYLTHILIYHECTCLTRIHMSHTNPHVSHESTCLTRIYNSHTPYYLTHILLRHESICFTLFTT